MRGTPWQAKGLSVGRVALSRSCAGLWRAGSRGFRVAAKDLRMPGPVLSLRSCLVFIPGIFATPAKRGVTAFHFSCSGPLCFLATRDGNRAMEMVERLRFTEFSLLYCYPGSVFVLVVLNLTTLGLLVAGPSARSRVRASRPLVLRERPCSDPDASADAPAVPTGKLYFEFVSSQGFVAGWQWVRNTVASWSEERPGRRAVNRGPAIRSGLRVMSRIQLFCDLGIVRDRARGPGRVPSASAKLGLGNVRDRHGDLSSDHFYLRVLQEIPALRELCYLFAARRGVCAAAGMTSLHLGWRSFPASGGLGWR